MATHSSVLAWRIPGTGEPCGLPSMGSQSRTRLKRLSSSNEYTTVYILECKWEIPSFFKIFSSTFKEFLFNNLM